MVSIMMIMMVQIITQIQVEMPGYLILLPAFFVSSHVFLSTTVLITVAITIERYQVVISQPLRLSLLTSLSRDTRLLSPNHLQFDIYFSTTVAIPIVRYQVVIAIAFIFCLSSSRKSVSLVAPLLLLPSELHQFKRHKIIIVFTFSV